MRPPLSTQPLGGEAFRAARTASFRFPRTSGYADPVGDAARRALVMALLFEGALGGLAILIGWLIDFDPLQTLRFDLRGLFWGVAGVLPMLAVFGLLVGVPAPPMVEIRRILDEIIGAFFVRCSTAELALVAGVAGLGEEALFRGLVQGYLEARLEPGTALLLASLLFGLVHPLTRAYVLLAAVFGCYLGWLWVVTQNLMTPVVAHGLYDFLALRTLVQRHRHSAQIRSDPGSRMRND
jgi:membrane protease YdiL (CAAX protease family)